MPASRPLYLYKFHGDNCTVHKIKPPLPARAKKFFKACDCFVWITGTTAKGEFVPRQSTGLRDWDAAEAYLASLNKKVAAEIVQGDQGITLADGIQKFLDGHEENVKAKAMAHHKLTLDRFKTYAAGQGVTYAKDVTYGLCKDFLTYGLPGISDNTKTTYRSKLKVFLTEAFVRRKWIKEDIAKMIKNVAAVYEEPEPYTDDEVALILAEAEKLNGGSIGYASKPKTFRLLLDLMLETGLRISDAARYDPSVPFKSKTGLWKYVYKPKKQPRGKTPKTAVTFLTDRLKLAIDQSDRFSKKFPFAYGSLADDRHERACYERLQAIGQRCVLEEEERDRRDNVVRPKRVIDDCRPHRFRDTFAVRKLLKGMALDDVSKLLAHSNIKVTQQHYAKWTVGREDRLEALFLQTL
jgi:integrase